VNEVNLVPSLLQAIVNIDGEALVMHAGDKPYVVSPSGQVELASRGVTLDAVVGIVSQLLPAEFQQALEEFGAVQYAMPTQPDFPYEQFTVVVARGGDDVWAEIRRKRLGDNDEVPEEFFDSPKPAPSLAIPEAGAPAAAGARHEEPVERQLHPEPEPEHEPADDALALPPATQLWPEPVLSEQAADAGAQESEPPEAVADEEPEPPVAAAAEEQEPSVLMSSAEPEPELAPAASFDTEPPASEAPEIEDPDVEFPEIELSEVEPAFAGSEEYEDAAVIAGEMPEPPATFWPDELEELEPVAADFAAESEEMEAAVEEEARPPASSSAPAVVLQMARNNHVRVEAPATPPSGDTWSGLERLLRTAAARGASTLYLSSNARPSVRVDGQLQSLDSEPVHTSSDVISLLLTLMPDRSHETLRTGATTEWICDIEDIGRVRCMSFTDHRGPGGVFRLMPVRAVTVEQLGLSPEIQSLAAEPEGLVLIVGSRSSGKHTLISALVDLVNRTRRDHVVTIEREVNIVHERNSSFISQREVRGHDVLAVAREALREDPDVLVLEQIRTEALMNVALEASASGHLVIAGLSAHNATQAIDHIINLYAPEQARHVQLALAENLRGIVAQVLLPKIGGGRVAAREVLLNTPAVASVISEGKTSQLPMAIEAGRRLGMVPLNDALVAYVQSGVADVREAYRHVSDRPTFLALLKRQGVDTSAIERPA
jgi:twitching motility protein PilT